MAKIALVVYIARILSVNQKEGFPASAAFKPIIIATAIVCVLIFPENFSTALLVASISMFMMFIGRVPFKYLLYTVGAAVVMLVIVVMLAKQFPDVSVVFHRVDTWISRVENFGSDEVDSDKSFQSNQAKIAIASGLFPQGPGNSIQRDFLPHPYSDFIFALIIEEYSAVAGIILLIIYLTLLYRAGLIMLKCSATFPAFLIIGIMVTITLQALAHMAVSVSLIPVTGQTLPFVSMGGTSVLFVSLAMGMVLSVSRFAVEGDVPNEIMINETSKENDEAN
jgi:cell division protein FtsW